MIGAVAGNKGAKFQSTPPVEGGDLAFVRIGMTAVRNFNPRHPWRVATLDLLHVLRHLVKFQSTPPVEGGDCATLTVTRYTEYFNPRHPWRVATVRPPSKKSKHGSFQSTPPVEGGDKITLNPNFRC